jgi:RNA polymerase sigma-70 factor (ECF subfamily)
MDSQLFEETYRAHYRQLRNTARQLIGDSDAAHDLVQEVFLKLWNKRNELHAILNTGAYLYRSVVNASLNYLEKNKKRRSTDDLSLPSDLSTEAGVNLRELQEKISEALDSLPPKCRAIFILSRFEEKKNKEIAVILGISLKTVENQMGIALKKMRDGLKSYLQNDLFLIPVISGTMTLLAALGQVC